MVRRAKSIPGNAGPEAAGDGVRLLNVYSTLVPPLPPRDFAHSVVAERDLSDAELTKHLEGFIGYVASRGDGEMNSSRCHLMRHLQHVKNQLILQIAASELPAFAGWAERANAVVFQEDGSIRDPQGAVLIDGEGRQDPAARIPHPEDAVRRKAKSEALLAERGLQVAPFLPPVFGAGEVPWRDADEVAGRAMALLVVANHALCVAEGKEGDLESAREALAGAFGHLSPAEAAFLENAKPDERAQVQMVWRFESLVVLAWALGILPELPSSGQICEVGKLVPVLLAAADFRRLSGNRLRPGAEILDALDLHFCLHWLVREAQLGRCEQSSSVIPGVVYERHFALNWLVRFGDADWDDVETPT
ncbi:MAG: DUF4272 domain-containing protein [Alphaproteobacteria bacterium]|nr:DUF4272 domain-containing protein [Alphaproteobacteria bacterium]